MPRSSCSSYEYMEVFVCEVPPPPYTGPTGFEDINEQTQSLRHAAQSPDTSVSTHGTPHKRPISGGVSGPKVIGRAVVLHTLFYVVRSLGTNAWGTRAVEYAIGTGCLASFMVLAKTIRLTDTLLACISRARGRSGRLDGRAEARLLIALTVGLSTGIPGIGYCIRSLVLEGPAEGHEFLTQAFSGVVPTFFVVMVTIWWMG